MRKGSECGSPSPLKATAESHWAYMGSCWDRQNRRMERSVSGPDPVAIAHGMRIYGLFRGAASGATVACENLFRPGLHLACSLMGHGLMVDSLVVIYYRIRTAGIKLIVHCLHAVIADVAVREQEMAAATNLFVPCLLVDNGVILGGVDGFGAVLRLPRVLMGGLRGGTRGRLGVRLGRRGAGARRRFRGIDLLVLGLRGAVGSGVLLLFDLLPVGGGGLRRVVRDLVHHVLVGIPRERLVDLGSLEFRGEGAGHPCAAEPEPSNDERDRCADGDLSLQGRCAAAAYDGNEAGS